METTSSAAAQDPSAAGSGDAAVDHRHGPLARRVTSGPGLYFYTWLPPEGAPPARAVVGLLHGFADYGGRYDHVARFWVARGIGVVAVDMRGHGRAEGSRGMCSRFGDYLDDVLELVELLRARAPDLLPFLFGHSFGGLVATHEALAFASRWNGLLLTAPNFGLAVKVPAVKRVAGQIASRLLPSFGLPSGLHGADVTHDPAKARAYDNDPLVFKNARARFFTEMLAAQKTVMAKAGALTLPLYLAMGTADPVADFAVARSFFQAAGSADKTWDPCDGLFHEILNEDPWPRIAGRMADWILTDRR